MIVWHRMEVMLTGILRILVNSVILMGIDFLERPETKQAFNFYFIILTIKRFYIFILCFPRSQVLPYLSLSLIPDLAIIIDRTALFLTVKFAQSNTFIYIIILVSFSTQ